MIRTTTQLLLAGLVAGTASAYAQVYTWKDAQGRTVMSDKKPPGKVIGERVIKGTAPDPTAPVAPPAAAAPATPAAGGTPGVDPEIEKRRKAQEDKAKADEERQKRERERLEKEQREIACKGLRQNLTSLESGIPIARPDDKGEMQYLEDSQRESEKAALRKQIADNCK